MRDETSIPASTRRARAGIRVTATSSESMTATEIATAMSRNSWPTSRSMTRIGMNTITVVSAETRMAPQTWLVSGVGRIGRVHSALSQPVDVLEHQDRGVDHQSDGKRESGKGNHVDRAAERRHGDERTDDRDRDGTDTTSVAPPLRRNSSRIRAARVPPM